MGKQQTSASNRKLTSKMGKILIYLMGMAVGGCAVLGGLVAGSLCVLIIVAGIVVYLCMGFRSGFKADKVGKAEAVGWFICGSVLGAVFAAVYGFCYLLSHAAYG